MTTRLNQVAQQQGAKGAGTRWPLEDMLGSDLVAAAAQRIATALQEAGIDTLVLGCTHYVFVEDALRALLGPQVQLVSTGPAVARQTQRLLEQAHLLHPGPAPQALQARVQLFTTGHLAGLQAAAERWLQLGPACCHAASAI